MGDIALGGVRTDEISVEVRPEALLEYGLALPVVADRVREAMVELPGGSVRTRDGEHQPAERGRRGAGGRDPGDRAHGGGRARGPARRGRGRAGRVRGHPADQPAERLPSANMTVFKKGDEDIVKIAEMVKAYAAGRRGETIELTAMEKLAAMVARPGSDAALSDRHAAYLLGLSKADRALPGELTTTTDLARFVVGRMDLLIRNAFWGGILVFATLVLLLNRRVSFWVAMGLIISLLGTLAVMKFMGITLNLLSMFGLIVVIGILVDDAIVVAENITAKHEKGEPRCRRR
jgi:HAE1 family hydrophobic/amphiphilic exporter-1